MRWHLVSLLLLLAQSTASAQRTGAVYGAGNIGCGEYLEDRRQNAYPDYYYSFVAGFVSSYNLFSDHPQVRTELGRSAVLAYLDKYCRDNPLNNVATGSIRLLGETGGWKSPGQ